MEETKEQRKARKARQRLEKEQNTFLKENKITEPNTDPHNILCVRFGNKYSKDYVEKLRNMIDRNISVPFNLYCLTDDPNPIPGVQLIVQPNAAYPKGWWHKIHMFDPKLPLRGRILYMDLDVVICNNIDKLTKIYNDDFMGIRDFNRKFQPKWKYLNSSVMSWVHGTQNHIYNQFMVNPNLAQRMHGDQDWTWKMSREKIKFWPENWIQSYKWEIRDRHDLQIINGVRQFRTIDNDIKPETDCCIVVFHGDPNPALVKDRFVLENWR